MSLEVNEIDPLWPDIEGDSIKEVFDVFWSFSQLEDYINTTIAAYYTDIYNTEFLNDVLRTDIISFSSKIGLLKTIANHLNIEFITKDLHACRDIRNIFAHSHYSDPGVADIFTNEPMPLLLSNGDKCKLVDDMYVSFNKHCDLAFKEVQKIYLQIINTSFPHNKEEHGIEDNVDVASKNRQT